MKNAVFMSLMEKWIKMSKNRYIETKKDGFCNEAK